MESTAISLPKEKTGGGKEAGQDDRDEEVEVAGEMQQLAYQANQVICGRRGGALGILPEELWLKILDEVVDSAEDIRNVLLALPQLAKLFQRKKSSWLFPLVLPHLLTKQLVTEVSEGGEDWIPMSSQKLLKLRLVSKRWKKAVERSLENHAARHPLPPRDKNDKVESSVVAVAIPENHFNYQRISINYTVGASRFEKAEDIDKFYKEMEDFQGNPFPGKSVWLEAFDDGANFGQAVARTVVLLERFGHHVLDLRIDHWTKTREVDADLGDLDLYRNILRCLTLVPNLKSLIFNGDFFGDTGPERDNFFGDPESQNLFPELRDLKRFEWRVDFKAESVWITRMLNAYGRKEGLRKLGIPLNLLYTLNLASYHSVHLTELHIFLDVEFDPNVGRIGRVVKAIPNHQEIRKFCLKSINISLANRALTVRMNELVRMLAEFKFESVDLLDLNLVEGPPISAPLLPAITVTSLDLGERGEPSWSFDFLRGLPNLKFLSVKIAGNRISEVLKEYRKMRRDGVLDLEVGSFGKRLTRYLMKAFDSALEISENEGIWKAIPSLEMLSLSIPVHSEEGNNMGVRFVRECGNRVFYGPRPNKVRWEGQRNVEPKVVDLYEMGRVLR